ncbi:MAG: hypothetical protein ACREOO_07135 [bacterium]
MSSRTIRLLLFYLLWSSFPSFSGTQQPLSDSARQIVVVTSGDTAGKISTPSKSAAQDSSSWFEKNPAQTALLGAIIGAIATLLGLQTIKKARKFSKAAKQGE